MKKSNFITKNPKETQLLGQILAGELRGGEIVCLSGDLGSGKTTFTQGLLSGLGVKGPYTSPTFIVMKQYEIKPKRKKTESKFSYVYHIDAYRINDKDMINLGWKEIAGNPENVIIIEWAERIRKIIPKNSLWLDFRWIDESSREIVAESK